MPENQEEPTVKAPYVAPKLEEFGPLRQLIQGSGSGLYDNQGCAGPPVGGAVREEDCP